MSVRDRIISEGRYSVKSRKSVTVACASGSVGSSKGSILLLRFAIASAILPLRLELGLVVSRGMTIDSDTIVIG